MDRAWESPVHGKVIFMQTVYNDDTPRDNDNVQSLLTQLPTARSRRRPEAYDPLDLLGADVPSPSLS